MSSYLNANVELLNSLIATIAALLEETPINCDKKFELACVIE